ncbi:MAG: 3-hydroxybutyrate dehydrogenase [Rickettsiales bacterium]|nr:3-hydroxybutyrate dehydrogenase [Rickettsiales bacterium]
MIKGKNAIVTGSTSGIGLAIAHCLAKAGCNILFNGLGDKAAISALVSDFRKTYHIEADYSPADMTKPKEITEMVSMGERLFGSVDILINNAGIQHTSPIASFPEDKWDAIIAINLSAAFHSTKAALAGMTKRDFGRIINIASVHGLVGSTNKSAYVAAKHGIVGFTKVTALEHASANITCNAICPGWVHTPLVQKQIEDKAKEQGISNEEATDRLLGEKQPNKRFIHAEQIGAMIVFLCDEHGSSMTGEIITMDGGWTAQ